MRDRAWRRHIREKFILKRIRKYNTRYSYWRLYEDANGYYVDNPIISDFIGSPDIKSYAWGNRCTWGSEKYSPNKSLRRHSSDWGRPGNTPNTREFNRRVLIKIKQEYGLK